MRSMQINSGNHPNIGIVSFPLLESGAVPLSNLIEILHSLSENLYIISGNAATALSKRYKGDNIYIYLVNHEAGTNTFTRIVKFIYTQLRISCKLARITKHVDLWFFFLGEGGLLLPMLTAKLLRKEVVIVSAASNVSISKAQLDSLSKPIFLLEKINRVLSNKIILYSPNLIKEWNLEKYRHKISIAHEHFLDFDKFKVEKPLGERGNLVGYVGRLSKEKGILNFLEAIPGVLEARDEVTFLIGGDGQMRPQVEECANKLDGKVKFVGWISHDELPRYLNELKLLVLPSYTEGLPNIMLEAMACGTPVLATPVGAIPDIIKDGETGFIMEDNSPECIAQNIIRALNHPNLEQIARNARALVEKEFTFEKAVERYGKIVNGEL